MLAALTKNLSYSREKPIPIAFSEQLAIWQFLICALFRIVIMESIIQVDRLDNILV
jgi:hypothetical protein